MAQDILVVRLSSLGDIVLTVPVYKNLKAQWPGCRITVLVKPQYVPVLEGHPCVDEVIPFEGLWATLSRIRARKFTHLLDLHATFRSFLLRRFSGIPNKARYRKNALARRLFVAIGWASPALTKHTIDRYLESLSAWGVATPDRSLKLGDWKAAPFGGQPPEHVLLLQTAFLGDATLTVPLAREIKRILPKCRLTVLARSGTADIFRSSPWVDETLEDDKRGAHRGPRGLWRLARALRASHFDLAIVPHRSLRSALLAFLSGIPRRIGFSSSAGRFLFTDALPFTWGMHDLERNLGLLLPLSPSVPESADTVYLRPKSGAAERLLAKVPAGKRLVGFHPGSIWPTKRWPEERFAALMRRMSEEAGIYPVLIGGKDDRELAARIASAAGVPVLDLVGQTSLAELIAVMSRLSLFVTNDSGPMHVATASGVPTLAFFGPTTKELGFFPYGSEHKVLEVELACRPCGLHGAKACPEGHFLCMNLISVDWAFRSAVTMMERKQDELVRASR